MAELDNTSSGEKKYYSPLERSILSMSGVRMDAKTSSWNVKLEGQKGFVSREQVDTILQSSPFIAIIKKLDRIIDNTEKISRSKGISKDKGRDIPEEKSLGEKFDDAVARVIDRNIKSSGLKMSILNYLGLEKPKSIAEKEREELKKEEEQLEKKTEEPVMPVIKEVLSLSKKTNETLNEFYKEFKQFRMEKEGKGGGIIGDTAKAAAELAAARAAARAASSEAAAGAARSGAARSVASGVTAERKLITDELMLDKNGKLIRPGSPQYNLRIGKLLREGYSFPNLGETIGKKATEEGLAKTLLTSGAKLSTKLGAKALPFGIGGAISGGIEYAETGNIGRSLAVGLGSAVGGGLGFLGGSLGGPVGSIAGTMAGSYAGEALGGGIYDYFAGQEVTPTEKPLPAATPSKIDQSKRVGNTASTVSGGIGSLLDFIAKGEGGYNSMNQGTSGNQIIGSTNNASATLGKNLTDMTVGEIKHFQALPQGDPKRLFAAGRYQIIPETMLKAMSAAGVSDKDLFDSNTQDKLAIGLLTGTKQPNLAKYLKGQSNDQHAAMKELAAEWASIPDPDTGISKYGKGNKALHSVTEVAAALTSARNKISGSARTKFASTTPSIPAPTPKVAASTASTASTGQAPVMGERPMVQVSQNIPTNQQPITDNQFYIPDPSAPYRQEDHYAAYFNANNPPAYAALG